MGPLLLCLPYLIPVAEGLGTTCSSRLDRESFYVKTLGFD